MLSSDEIAHLSVLTLLDVPALVLSSILVVAIVMRTPASLHSFSVLLLNTAIVDFTAAVISLTVAVRFINEDGVIILVFIGPCTLFGGRFCHAMQSIHVGLLAHSSVLLLLSLSYRLWVSRSDILRPEVVRSRLWIIAMASTVPSWSMMVTLYNAASFDVPSVDERHPNEVYSALLLHADRVISGENALARGTVLLTVSIFSVCFAAIAAVRTRLLHRIRALNNNVDRSRHQMIFNCLTAQALLPLSSVAGSTFWLVDFLDIVRSPYLQRSGHMMSSVFALGSPIINLVFLPPYRKFVGDIFLRRKGKPQSISQQSGSLGSRIVSSVSGPTSVQTHSHS